MRMSYDPEADALHIALTDGGEHDATQRKVAPGVFLSWSKDQRLVGLEMLNASKHVPRRELEQIASAVERRTPQELAKLHGLNAGTIANAAAAGRFPGTTKVGGTWLIPAHEFENYLETRAPSGRPPKARKARKARRQQREQRSG